MHSTNLINAAPTRKSRHWDRNGRCPKIYMFIEQLKWKYRPVQKRTLLVKKWKNTVGQQTLLVSTNFQLALQIIQARHRLQYAFMHSIKVGSHEIGNKCLVKIIGHL